MANDKMTLELLLKGKDQLAPIIKNQISLLKQFKRETDKTSNSLKKLLNLSPKSSFGNFGKQLTSEIRRSNTEANKLKKTLESIRKIKTSIPKGDNSTSNVSTRNVKKEQDELDKLLNKKQKSKSYIDRLANINDKVLEPATQVKNVWKEQIDSLRQYTDETKKLYLAQSKFKLINLSESENKRAFEAVSEVVRKFGTVTQTEGIETLTDLHTAIGNIDHAIEALPTASKYRFSMKTLFGDKFSDSEIEEQIQNAFKFLEVTGKVAKGREEMERSFNVLTQMTNATALLIQVFSQLAQIYSKFVDFLTIFSIFYRVRRVYFNAPFSSFIFFKKSL